MGKYVVSFNSLEDRASLVRWARTGLYRLLITPHKSSAAEHLVGFFTEKGIIERLPREYPIGSTVWTNKGYGTVLVRLGKYHLVWLQRLGLA